MTETDLQRRIQLSLSDKCTRLFRNNNGEAWLGRTFSVVDGRLVDGKATRIAYGLANGSSDLIGLRSVIVTPDMVGQCVAIFTAVEVKSARGVVADDQRAFVDTVIGLGGRAGIARSLEDAIRIVK